MGFRFGTLHRTQQPLFCTCPLYNIALCSIHSCTMIITNLLLSPTHNHEDDYWTLNGEKLRFFLSFTRWFLFSLLLLLSTEFAGILGFLIIIYLFIARANQTLDGHTMRAIINLGDTTNLFANKFNSSTFLAFILSQPSLFVLCFYIALFSHRFIHWYFIPQMMMIPVAIQMANADRR